MAKAQNRVLYSSENEWTQLQALMWVKPRNTMSTGKKQITEKYVIPEIEALKSEMAHSIKAI